MGREPSPVCNACGWYDPAYARHSCDPEAGVNADRLAAAVCVSSTKLGYGDGRLSFEIDDDFVVGLSCDSGDFPFRWSYLHHLGDLSTGDAIDLIDSLKLWRRRCDARKEI